MLCRRLASSSLRVKRILDNVAEVGTIIAVIQLADRVAILCKYCIETVRDAPHDIRSILLETSMLKAVLEYVHYLAEHQDDLSSIVAQLDHDGVPKHHCRAILGEMRDLLAPLETVTEKPDPAQPKRRKTEGLSNALARLAWPLKETKARKMLQELNRYISLISLALVSQSA